MMKLNKIKKIGDNEVNTPLLYFSKEIPTDPRTSVSKYCTIHTHTPGHWSKRIKGDWQ